MGCCTWVYEAGGSGAALKEAGTASQPIILLQDDDMYREMARDCRSHLQSLIRPAALPPPGAKWPVRIRFTGRTPTGRD